MELGLCKGDGAQEGERREGKESAEEEWVGKGVSLQVCHAWTAECAGAFARYVVGAG